MPEIRTSMTSVPGLVRDLVYSWNKGWAGGSNWARNDKSGSL